MLIFLHGNFENSHIKKTYTTITIDLLTHLGNFVKQIYNIFIQKYLLMQLFTSHNRKHFYTFSQNISCIDF